MSGGPRPRLSFPQHLLCPAWPASVPGSSDSYLLTPMYLLKLSNCGPPFFFFSLPLISHIQMVDKSWWHCPPPVLTLPEQAMSLSSLIHWSSCFYADQRHHHIWSEDTCKSDPCHPPTQPSPDFSSLFKECMGSVWCRSKPCVIPLPASSRAPCPVTVLFSLCLCSSYTGLLPTPGPLHLLVLLLDIPSFTHLHGSFPYLFISLLVTSNRALCPT